MVVHNLGFLLILLAFMGSMSLMEINGLLAVFA